jgi:hypothetical protein
VKQIKLAEAFGAQQLGAALQKLRRFMRRLQLSEDLHPLVLHRCANQSSQNYYGASAGGPGNNAESPVG